MTAVLPLLVVAAIFAKPTSTWAMRLGPLCALPALVISISPIGLEPVEIPWLFMGSIVGLDRTGRLFLFVTALVWLIAAIFAQSDGVKGGREGRFFAFFYTAMAGNLVLIVAGDVITFLTGFAVMSYAGYGLVVHRCNREAIRAARVYVVLVVFAEVLLFAGAVMAWGGAGSWELPALREALGVSGSVAMVATALLFCGFGVKAAMIPLHVWLPLAHPAAPVPASAVLSAAMIKAGLLGWIRFMPFGLEGQQWLGWWAFSAGAIAAMGGVIVGLVQSRPKTILAYSSISQMGYMTMLLALSAFVPAMYPAVSLAILVYVVHHAVSKGALFLSVTVARGAPHRWWTKLLEAMGLVIPALALAGAPLTTGAVAKAELARIPYARPGQFPALLDWLLIVGAVATTVLMARFLWVVWPRTHRVEPVSLTARVVWFGLATAVLWAPWFLPWEYLRRSAAAAIEPAAIWSAVWPLALGALLSLIVVRRHELLPIRVHDRIPAGDLLVPVVRLLKIIGLVITIGTRLAQAILDIAIETVRDRLIHSLQRLRILALIEARLRKQAWDWLWILLVGACLFAALIL